MPALLETYAARRGLSVARIVRSDADFDMVLADPGTGFDVARVGFRLSDSDGGMARLLLGEADIAMTLREAHAAERQAARAAGLGDIAAPGQNRILGLDALVPAVARGNPATQISVNMLAQMLAGQVAEWPATGGPVLLHGRDRRKGAAQVVQQNS